VTAAPADAPVDSFQPAAAALSASDDTAMIQSLTHEHHEVPPVNDVRSRACKSTVGSKVPACTRKRSFKMPKTVVVAADGTSSLLITTQPKNPSVSADRGAATSLKTSGVAPDPHSCSLDIIDNSGNDFVDAVDAFSEDVAIESLTLTMGNDHSVPIVACPAGGLVRTGHFAPRTNDLL